MANRHAITLLHWITTIVIGSVLSGLLNNLMNNTSISNSIMKVVSLWIIFSGLISFPILLLALFILPRILNGIRNRHLLQVFFSAISAGFVVIGFIAAGLFLGGLMEIFDRLYYVLIGFCAGAILSGIIWVKMYKPDSHALAREIETLDSDLLN